MKTSEIEKPGWYWYRSRKNRKWEALEVYKEKVDAEKIDGEWKPINPQLCVTDKDNFPLPITLVPKTAQWDGPLSFPEG